MNKNEHSLFFNQLHQLLIFCVDLPDLGIEFHHLKLLVEQII